MRLRAPSRCGARERRRLLTWAASEIVTVRLPCATRDHRHAHVAAHHDDAERSSMTILARIRLDLQLLDLGQQGDHVALNCFGR